MTDRTKSLPVEELKIYEDEFHVSNMRIGLHDLWNVKPNEKDSSFEIKGFLKLFDDMNGGMKYKSFGITFEAKSEQDEIIQGLQNLQCKRKSISNMVC